MSPRLSVTTLPEDIRNELDIRLADSNFGGYDAHAEWLKERGYPISRSAIHRYAQTNAAHIQAAANNCDGPSVIDLRMRCLEVAARFAGKDTLIEDADRLLQWVSKP